MKTLVEAVHTRGRVAMADIATMAEARNASALGADIIGTTMSGYTDAGPPPRAPDIGLVAARPAGWLSQSSLRVAIMSLA